MKWGPWPAFRLIDLIMAYIPCAVITDFKHTTTTTNNQKKKQKTKQIYRSVLYRHTRSYVYIVCVTIGNDLVACASGTHVAGENDIGADEGAETRAQANNIPHDPSYIFFLIDPFLRLSLSLSWYACRHHAGISWHTNKSMSLFCFFVLCVVFIASQMIFTHFVLAYKGLSICSRLLYIYLHITHTWCVCGLLIVEEGPRPSVNGLLFSFFCWLLFLDHQKRCHLVLPFYDVCICLRGFMYTTPLCIYMNLSLFSHPSFCLSLMMWRPHPASPHHRQMLHCLFF